MYQKNRKIINEKVKTFLWTIQMAFNINKTIFIVWLLVNAVLAILPTVSLALIQKVIVILSAFQNIQPYGYSQLLMYVMSLGIVLFLINLSTRITSSFIEMTMQDSYYLGLQERIMECAQKIDLMDIMEHDAREEYISVALDDTSLVTFISTFCLLFREILSAISLLTFAFIASKEVLVASVIYLVVALIINTKQLEESRLDDRTYHELRSKCDYFETLTQQKHTEKEIRIFGLADQVIQQWKSVFEALLTYDKKRDFLIEQKSFHIGVVYQVFVFIVLGIATNEVVNGSLTIALFVTLFNLCVSMHSSIANATRLVLTEFETLYYLQLQKQMFEKYETSIPDLSGADISYKENEPLFSVQNLCFSYPGCKDVLHNISLKIYPNEIVAFVGENGAGKTTLTKILLGIYKPDSGDLYYRGIKYNSIDQNFLRKEIGAFFQDFVLFHKSIRENIGFGAVEHIEDEQAILSAVLQADCDKLIGSLEQGFDTIIGRFVDTNGVELSVGEQYKIAVARAFMGSKPVLVFDEPGAALDPLSEERQFANIRNCLNKRAGILISHRIGFARLADRIFVLKNGEIVQEGTHEQLVQEDGYYRNLYNLQADMYIPTTGGVACETN